MYANLACICHVHATTEPCLKTYCMHSAPEVLEVVKSLSCEDERVASVPPMIKIFEGFSSTARVASCSNKICIHRSKRSLIKLLKMFSEGTNIFVDCFHRKVIWTDWCVRTAGKKNISLRILWA